MMGNILKKPRLVLAGCALLLLLAAGAVIGTAAYMQDAEEGQNILTIGHVELELTETEWTEPEKVTPEGEYPKNPVVTNTGTNDEVVFLEITVPYVYAKTNNEDGTVNAPKFLNPVDFKANSGWTAVSMSQSAGSATYGAKKTEDGKKITEYAEGSTTYVYAYTGGSTDTVMKVLHPGDSTDPLFDDVELANLTEYQGTVTESGGKVVDTWNPAGKTVTVSVKAYGIQADYVLDASGTATQVPSDIWEIYCNQN